MDISQNRIAAASFAGILHLVTSVLVAAVAAILVFTIWYPQPFGDLSGGRNLFLLIIAVDVICGPVLTFIVFNPVKPRRELIKDLLLIVLIQIAALVYGAHILWKARPLFLVHEVDRFKVISAPNLNDTDFSNLVGTLRPTFFRGPVTISLRMPINNEERELVMRESVLGGRDYAERPEFYVPYDGKNALKSLQRAKPLAVFLQKQPDQTAAAQKLALEKKADITQWVYLPVIARQDWIAVLDKQGQIQGFLKGDGF